MPWHSAYKTLPCGPVRYAIAGPDVSAPVILLSQSERAREAGLKMITPGFQKLNR